MSCFIGRESQIEKFNQLLKSRKGQLWVIEGEGGLGKTTLLRRLESLAQEKKQAHLFISIDDLQLSKTVAEFLLSLAAKKLPAYQAAMEKAEGIYRTVQAQMKTFSPELKESVGFLKDAYVTEEYEKQLAAVADKYLSTFLHAVGKMFTRAEEQEKKSIAENIEHFLLSALLNDCVQHPVIFVDTYEHLFVKESFIKQSVDSQLDNSFKPFSRKATAIKTYGFSIWFNKFLQLLADKGAMVIVAGRHFDLWRTQLEQLDKFSEQDIQQLVVTSDYPKIKALSQQAETLEALLLVLKRISFGGNPLWLTVGMNFIELLLCEGKDILTLAHDEKTLQDCFEYTSGTLHAEEIEHASCKLAIFKHVTRQLPADLVDQVWKLAIPRYLDEEILSILLGDKAETVIPLYKNLRVLNQKRGDKTFYLHEELQNLLRFYARDKKYWDSETTRTLHDKLAVLFEKRAKRKQDLLPNLTVEWLDLSLAAKMYYHQACGKEADLKERMGGKYVLASAAQKVIDDSDNSDNWLHLGYGFFILGCKEEAIGSYDKVVALNPNDDSAWFNRGVVLSVLGRKEEALESYNKAIALNPHYDSAWFNRGNVLSDLGHNEEALESYDKAIALNPNDYSAWFNRGNVLSVLKRKEETLESYDKAIALNPNDYSAWFNRGNVLSVLKRKEETLESYDKAIALNPNDDSAWFNRGVVLSYLGRKEEALESYNKAIALNPHYDSAWFNRGNVLSDLGHKEEVLESYDKAIALNPNYDLAWFNRGNVLSVLGHKEKALDSYDKAIALNPNYDSAWFNRGVVLSVLGRKEEALESYNKAIALNPNDDSAWFNRGNVLSDLGHNEEALESYDKAIALNPNKNSAWNNRGIVLSCLGRKEEVLESYDKAIALNPNDDSAWFNRGVVLSYLGRKEEALESYNKAITLNPNYDSAWFNRGNVLSDLGRKEEALESYDKAITLNPDDSLTWVMRGRILMLLKRYREVASTQTALELEPKIYKKLLSPRGIFLFEKLTRFSAWLERLKFWR